MAVGPIRFDRSFCHDACRIMATVAIHPFVVATVFQFEAGREKTGEFPSQLCGFLVGNRNDCYNIDLDCNRI
jgi:hypothetical protein